MVTLDDAEIRPIGAARRHTFLLAFLAIVSTLAVAAIIAIPVSVAAGDPWGLASADSGFRRAIRAAIGPAGLVRPLLIVLALATTFGAGFLATRRARRRASVHIADESGIAPAADLVGKRSRRVFASRLVVARVPGEHWRSTVRAFAAVCDAVVIDVSQPSEHLIWELNAMRAFYGDRWVLVCHRDRVGALTDDGAEGAPQRELVSLLDGQEVLLYGDGSRHRRQFARALRRRLALALVDH